MIRGSIRIIQMMLFGIVFLSMSGFHWWDPIARWIGIGNEAYREGQFDQADEGLGDCCIVVLCVDPDLYGTARRKPRHSLGPVQRGDDSGLKGPPVLREARTSIDDWAIGVGHEPRVTQRHQVDGQ